MSQKKIVGNQVDIKLSELSDVQAGSPQTGNTLIFNGSDWEANAPSSSNFNITNGQSGEGNQSFFVPDDTDTIVFLNLEVNQVAKTISVVPLHVKNVYDGPDIQVFPNENASVVNHPMQLVFGAGLTATVTGAWGESVLVTATGGGGATNLSELSDVATLDPANGDVLTFNGVEWNAAPPATAGATTGTANQVLMSDGAGAYLNADAYITSTSGQDGILTLGTNGSENAPSGSTITTMQYGAGNGRDGTNLTVAASDAFFPFDTLTKNGGSLILQAGRGGQVTGTNRHGQGGDASLSAGNGRGAPGGNLSLSAGVNEISGGGSDGGLTLSAGRVGGNGGHVKVVTSTIERLRIGSNGAWNLNASGGGGVGQVITSNGSGTPPSWQDVSKAETQTFIFDSSSPIDFGGNNQSAWLVSELYSVASPKVTYDSYAQSFTLVEDGVYEFDVQMTASANLGNWPNGLTSYGTELVHSGGSLFGGDRMQHQRYAALSDPGWNQELGFASGQQGWTSWLDTFTLQAGAGTSVTVYVFCFSYNNSGDPVNVSGKVRVRKVSSSVGD